METSSGTPPSSFRPPAIRVTVEQTHAPAMVMTFREPIRIGSGKGNDLVIVSAKVGEVHAEIDYEDHCWWIRGIEGSPGLFLDGKRVEAFPLATGAMVSLGRGGPVLSFEIVPSVEHAAARGILRLPDQLRNVIRASTRIISVEEHKEIVRLLVGRVEKLQTQKYRRVVVAVAVLVVAGSVYGYFKHEQYEALEERAKTVFYQMKDLEIGLSKLRDQVVATGDSSAQAEVEQYWRKLEEMNASYDAYVDELGVYKDAGDEQARAIYRVARVFGECELDMPKGFVSEVERYIHEWKLSDRLPSAIQRAKDLGYGDMIRRVMLDQHLPPQFYYLALQESGFDTSRCGPITRYGIAKGMWQFIPSTALHYGLRTGPLVELQRNDPKDERHIAAKSTEAAAHYLHDIYNTEAQASGLLVVASYNWGPSVVRGLIRTLPENPRQRNFWAFLATHKDKIPKETYDYVYFVFSAAVIGENPKLFGFGFDRPFTAGM